MIDSQNKGEAKILIVENEVLIAADLESRLKGMGYTVCGMETTGEKALESVERHRPDLVIMDIVLRREMDGIETAEHIRHQWGIPVVFLTAYADRKRLERAKLAHPFGYILKPFYDRDLKITLEMALYAAKMDAERKRTEEALRQSEEKFSLAFRTSPYAVAISRVTDGKFIDVNETFTSITGFSREEATADTSTGLKLWTDKKDRNRMVAALLEKGTLAGREYLFRKKNGDIIIGLFSAQIMHLADEKCILSSIYDITGQKRAEEEKERLQSQLQQAQKLEAVGALAGGIAHDFNNLLQAITGYTQILLLNKIENDPEHQNLKAIQNAADRAAQLVRQLLLFSRKAETDRISLDLNHQIEQSRKVMERTIPNTVDIEVQAEGRLWNVKADPAQMEQILLNLGTNAVDAMPEGGRLIIETQNVILDEFDVQNRLSEKPGRHVLLKVSDTGHGMDESVVKHIFEPFYTTKEIGKGTGLGLASVYGIVKSHGGSITCHSEVDLGTSFRIYLPAIDREETAGVKDVATEAPRKGAETILIVDDEEPIRDFASQILEKFKYTILTAASGEEALKIYTGGSHRIDLVVMDMGMPGMGGFRCLQEIVRFDPSSKILVVSGYSIDENVKKTLAAGAAGFIGKPYRVSDLLEKVRAVLDMGD